MPCPDPGDDGSSGPHGRRRRRSLRVAVVAVALAAAPARAQDPPRASPSPPAGGAEAAEVDPDSPRAALRAYLDLCRAGRYGEAARYLELPSGSDRGPDLARRLKAVLDRHVWFDLDRVSAASAGDAEDGLPPLTDQIGEIRRARGQKDPVRLVKSESAGGDGRWVFSAGTVRRVESWYQTLDDRWILDHLPEVLLRPGPRELLWWQWLALPVLVVLALGAGRLLAWLTSLVAGRLLARTRSKWDDALLERLSGPLVLGWTLGSAYALLPSLALYAPAHAFLTTLLRAGGLVAFFWALWRLVDVAGRVVLASPWGQTNPSARSLLGLGEKIGKVAVLALGVVASLSELGYPVAGLLAGLGVGGLALALAAQKTVENLFGSVSLAVDQPFRVGDFVRIEEFVGTIEAIGLRSTRIRTLDRTLITIPNGKLADMRVESFTARDRMRLACILGVEYGTTAAQMRQVLEGLEGVLRAHPKIWPEAVVVRFKEFGASSLDIEIMAWFETSVWSEFQLIRQEVLLQFMDVVERAGTSFAFPTRTVHLVQPAAAPPKES